MKLRAVLLFYFLIILSAVAYSLAKVPERALIVAGRSIGKVHLGQRQDEVHKTLGMPTQGIVREFCTIDYNSQPYRRKRKVLGNLSVDLWKWPLTSAERKRNIRSITPSTWEVVYRNGRAVQITCSRPSYRMMNGLSLNSKFSEFTEIFDRVETINFDFDSDRQFGTSFAMKAFLDLRSEGLTIESDYYTGDGNPELAMAISVHAPQTLFLFDACMYHS